ncbi:MAG: C25 family cysteine peptidase, partial [Thermoplasmatota archaeon]
DLIIITPEEYVDDIGFFVENKTKHGLSVEVKPTEEIYNEYWGRDHQEQIKRYLFDMVKLNDVSYVLILGDIKTVPIRNSDAYPWDDPKPFHGKGILTDLYYADVYDETFEFCSWDANNNGIFGEVDYGEMHQFPPTAGNIDQVDLYADVHIGRIPATNVDELIIVLKKICRYEKITAYQLWFNKIILAGGDTFPLSKGSPFNQFEGEITNIKVGQQLPGFEKVFLWSSERNLNALTFNAAISKGAGFVSYAGHGFEHGWGTYRPNAVIDKNLIIYYTPFLKGINNGDKTPIIFFDACLTAKLDFNISDLISYYGDKARFVNRFLKLDPMDFLPSFAWSFLKKENGGAIATIGATRPAYTWVDMDGVYAGAGYLDVRFFHAYEEGITVGEMLTQAQNDYLNYVMKDFFTIEEYILLGDPSMIAGGHP